MATFPISFPPPAPSTATRESMVTNDTHREAEGICGGGRRADSAPSGGSVAPSRALSPPDQDVQATATPGCAFFFTSLRFPTAGSSFLSPLCLFLPHLFFPSFHVLLRLLALILATSRALLSAPHDAFSAWRAATWDPQLTEKLRNKRVFVFFPSVKASIALISSPCQTFGVQQLYVYYRAVYPFKGRESCEQQI